MKRTITTLALAAILAGTSHAAISGKKPAFMDKQQLAAMRAEAASVAIKESYWGQVLHRNIFPRNS